MAATVGHEAILYGSTRILSKMVSTCIRARVNKQTEAGHVAPSSTTAHLADILEGQPKMQQELADLKKRSADEIEALRQENLCLRRKIEVDPTQKGKAKETSEAAKSLAFQPSKEESEYNPTPHTFTTTQQTPIISTNHTHFHPTLLGHTTTPTPAATLPTTDIPSYNFPSTLKTSNKLFIPSSTIPSLFTRYHPHNPGAATLLLISSPTPFSLPSGSLSH